MRMARFRKQQGSKRFWVVIAAAGFMVFITMGVRQGFGLFLGPITDQLLFSREGYALSIAVQNLLWGACAPVFGAFVDKHGVVKIGVIGTLLYASGLVVMAFGGVAGVFAGQAMIGIAMAAIGIGVMLGVVAKSAPINRRSLALGITTASGSLGQFAIVLLTQELISIVAWQLTLVIMAVLVTTILAMLLTLRHKEQETTLAAPAIEALGRALRYKHYLLLTTGFFVCGFQVVFISTHLPIFLTDGGLSPRVAGTTLGLIGLFNLLGTLLFGYLGGRWSKKLLLSTFYIARSVIIGVFLLVPLSNMSALVFGAAIGFLWLATVPLTSGLIAALFGIRNMAMLYGVTFFSHQLGSFMGAWVGGNIYGMTGSYDIMWWLIIGAGVVAAVLHLPIKERLAPGKYQAAPAT